MGEMACPLDDDAAALWSNPAMLAFGSAWRLQGTRSVLTPGLADEITLSSFALTGDLSVAPREAATGAPSSPARIRAGLGYTWLDLGESEAIDQNGDVIDTFRPGDHLVNLVLAGRPLDFLAIGIAGEITYSDLRPEVPELAWVAARATSLSVSFGAALAPELRLPARGLSAEFAEGRPGAAVHLRPIAAASVLHIGTDVRYNAESGAEELPRQFHAAGGLRAGFDPGGSRRFLDPIRLLQWDIFAGYEYDQSMLGYGRILRHWGVEVRAFGLLAVRAGRREAEESENTGNTRGVGIGIEGVFPIGLRVDWAKIPPDPGMERWEASLFLDRSRL